MTNPEGKRSKTPIGRESAVFLIDQFNKYASWKTTARYQLFWPRAAMLFSLVALIVSCLALFPELRPTTWQGRMLSFLVYTVVPLAVYGYESFRMKKDLREIADDESVLFLLMNYLSENDCLPGDLTFERIASSELEELEEMLGNEKD